MARGFKASPEGIEKANQALRRNELTQTALAESLEKHRSTINKFFNGKTVDRYIFEEICDKLNLKWNEICEPQNNSPNIDTLVQDIRQKIKANIEQSCGTIRVLDMTQPIDLGSIYTQVNILEKITGRRRLELKKLSEDLNLENFDRFCLNKVKEERLEGLKAVQDYKKLMVLGKPGAGKTTFLKYLSMQCSTGGLLKNYVPIFIPLKQFAETQDEPGLLDYISKWLDKCGVTEAPTKVQQILKAGRALVLLDGLDEVREEDSVRIITQIQEFSQQFNSSQFVITCRIAAREYTFTQFTEVEVADFEDEQIQKFANCWFEIKRLDYANDFIQQLEEDPQIKELATSPLLLTLLCLEFEDSRNFPKDRAELYKRATETLLRKWDDKRQIYRQQVYKQLFVKRKEDLLSQVAFNTFSEKKYFFKQRIVENYIADYISNLPDAPTETEKLHLDSEAVLKSIEAQHGLLVERAIGIYSFSHLTFQEYFTARKIVSQQTLSDLVKHITEKRWREVFILTSGMLSNTNELLKLMKQQVDGILAIDEKVQEFLTWVSRKASSVKTSHKPAAVRACYLNLSLNLNLNLNRYPKFNLTRDLSCYLNRDLSRDFSQDFRLNLSQNLKKDLSRYLSPDLSQDLSSELRRDLSIYLTRDLSQDLNRYIGLEITTGLGEALQGLKKQLPHEDNNTETIIYWWLEHGQSWSNQLRNVMIEHRDIGHKWEFNEEEKKSLEKYLDANNLLLDCLDNGYVTRAVREEIESTLYLPFEKVKKQFQ
ncbi:MAG: NACHT domain-containing NTPase [Mastigocoleus sp. MO_167.B18]|nr:NACHT domain-containing NTPase [Mastigocoleus sp. MO_167.B18]